jgi:hypothetical protein
VPEHPLDRPVLITGTPRSGKTVVRKILRAADEFLCVDEPLLMWNYGLGARRDDRRTADDATPEVAQRIRADLRERLERSGKDRYLDDLSYHALRIPFIRAVLPEALIVHVVRDGQDALPELLYGWTYRDTVSKAVSRRWRNLRWHGLPRQVLRFARNYAASRLRGRRETWGPRPPGLQQFARGRSTAEVAAFQWLQMVLIAIDDLEQCPPESWIQLRLDRLLADPRAEVGRLLEFCRPRDSQAVLQHALGMIDPDYRFEKKVQPSDEQWAKITSLISPLRQRLGYQTSQDAPPQPAVGTPTPGNPS